MTADESKCLDIIDKDFVEECVKTDDFTRDNLDKDFYYPQT